MKIVLSENLSYCTGVRETLRLVDRLLSENPDRAYCMLGEIVHNEIIIEGLKKKGLRIVDRLEDIPGNGVVILQSHGSPRVLYEAIERLGLDSVDATCPMVKLIHKRIRALEDQGYVPVVIGKAGHEEVTGIAGQVEKAVIVKSEDEVTKERFRGVRRAGIVVQSTFITEEANRIVEKIREIVPDVVFHDTICHPTKVRQSDVEEHSKTADGVLVIGSRRSANTMHLFHIAARNNPRTYLVDSPEAAEGIDFAKDEKVFVASGASTPEDLIFEVIAQLQRRAELRDLDHGKFSKKG